MHKGSALLDQAFRDMEIGRDDMQHSKQTGNHLARRTRLNYDSVREAAPYLRALALVDERHTLSHTNRQKQQCTKLDVLCQLCFDPGSQ